MFFLGLDAGCIWLALVRLSVSHRIHFEPELHHLGHEHLRVLDVR